MRASDEQWHYSSSKSASYNLTQIIPIHHWNSFLTWTCHLSVPRPDDTFLHRTFYYVLHYSNSVFTQPLIRSADSNRDGMVILSGFISGVAANYLLSEMRKKWYTFFLEDYFREFLLNRTYFQDFIFCWVSSSNIFLHVFMTRRFVKSKNCRRSELVFFQTNIGSDGWLAICTFLSPTQCQVHNNSPFLFWL